jgi:ankyrin repeat protein
VEVILRAGADVNARDEDGRTALLQVLSLFEAMKYAKTESEYSGGKISPRFCEVMFKDLKPAPVARLLIAHGADVNAASRKGQTPIAYAALSGDIELVGELLAKGADANVKDAYGTTPLELAISSGHKEIAAMLREHGAKE